MTLPHRVTNLAAHLTVLVPPASSPVAAGNFRMEFLYAIDDFLRVERHAACGRAILGRLGVRNDEHHHAVHDHPGALGEDGEHDERDPYDRDVDVEIRGEAVAHTGDHRAFADLIETLGGG